MEPVGDLQIHEDLPFQEREWKAERIAWVLLLTLVALAVAGLFGHGPVSWTTASTDDGSLSVSYERFGRRGGTQELVLEAPASAARAGAWEVELSKALVASVTIDSISPPPASVEVADGAFRYTFAQAESGAPLQATFALTPSSMWRSTGHVGLSGGQPLSITHFFFP